VDANVVHIQRRFFCETSSMAAACIRFSCKIALERLNYNDFSVFSIADLKFEP